MRGGDEMISGIGGGYMDPSQMTAMRGQGGKPFEAIDSSGNGSLDKIELSAFAEEISGMTGQTVDADQMISDLDADEDGAVSQEEFESGRPKGPPPGMMGDTQGGGLESLLDMLNSSDEDSTSTLDSLDTNGDGVVDAEEAKSGINYLIQEYLSQMSNTLGQDSEKGSQLNLQV